MFLALTQDIPVDNIVPLLQYDNRVSVANNGTFALMSNICPHQNSRIAKCATDHLQCPYHGLKFDINGTGIDNQYSLEKWQIYKNQTMLFDQHVSCTFPVDTQYMTLAEHRQDIVRANASTIMDVFLDIDHISVAHKGVYDKIGITDVDEITWSTFENGSIQFVAAQENVEMVPADRQYNISACWMAVYPGTMIEWQPGALFVTVAHGIDENTSRVQVYKYKDNRYWEEAWELNSQVWETAWAQDRGLAEAIVYPSEHNLDPLKKHYRTWMQDAV
jgi:phenylpropionate dioxygenase-like ring-hydroxylating dioxygenase large terminal subunit